MQGDAGQVSDSPFLWTRTLGTRPAPPPPGGWMGKGHTALMPRKLAHADPHTVGCGAQESRQEGEADELSTNSDDLEGV